MRRLVVLQPNPTCGAHGYMPPAKLQVQLKEQDHGIGSSSIQCEACERSSTYGTAGGAKPCQRHQHPQTQATKLVPAGLQPHHECWTILQTHPACLIRCVRRGPCAFRRLSLLQHAVVLQQVQQLRHTQLLAVRVTQARVSTQELRMQHSTPLARSAPASTCACCARWRCWRGTRVCATGCTTPCGTGWYSTACKVV